jgi:hypothetical protein
VRKHVMIGIEGLRDEHEFQFDSRPLEIARSTSSRSATANSSAV